jgi:hypothetical protein
MYIKLLLVIFPVILFAGNIIFGLTKHDGQSSYIVHNDLNLKSKLKFPFKLYSLDIGYDFNYNNLYNFSCGLSTDIKSEDTIGKDYDWKNNNLTVFSKSTNKLDNYYKISTKISKKLYPNIDIFFSFSYQILNVYWQDTYQYDYIKDHNSKILKKTLSYKQNFYIYNLGINYNKSISNKFQINISPSLLYVFINTKDSHLLRNFYTIANTQAKGYGLFSAINYNLSSVLSMQLFIKNIYFKDTNVDMDYYDNFNKKYLTFPSSYTFHDNRLGIRNIYLY